MFHLCVWLSLAFPEAKFAQGADFDFVINGVCGRKRSSQVGSCGLDGYHLAGL